MGILAEDGQHRRQTISPGGRLEPLMESKVLRRNGRAVWLGLVSLIGALGVISFPENSSGPHIGKVHGLSAAVFFMGTYVYLCIHCWLDHNAIVGGISTSAMRRVRLGLCIVEGGGFIGLFAGVGS